MRSTHIKNLIASSRGLEDADLFSSYKLDNPKVLVETAKEVLSAIEPSFGACTLMSACWSAFLRDKHNIPAVVIAGDLNINGNTIFKCKENIPQPGKTGKVISKKWDGHCWVEIDNYIGDLSIFRTAYSINRPSLLRNFVLEKFGAGRGALLCPIDEIQILGIEYKPKFVLNENQINGIVAALHK